MNNNSIKEFARQVLEKEIEGIKTLHQNVNDIFIKIVTKIAQTKGKIVVIGLGKSGHIGKKIAATMASIGIPAFYMHPTEALHGDLGMITSQDTSILISNSGNTEEVIQVLDILNNRKIPTITISSQKKSYLAKNGNYSLVINTQLEADDLNLAPTTSTSTTLVLGDMLATTASKLKKITKEEFAQNHPNGTLGKNLLIKVENIVEINNYLFSSANENMKKIITNLTSSHLGCTLIIEKGKLKGIITDGDLRRAIELFEKNIFEMNIEQIMTRNPLFIQPEMLAVDALQLMKDKKITQLPVIKNNVIVGIIHIHKILEKGLQ